MQKKLNHLGLFAKYWEPGKVKTRLAAKIGHSAASEIYRVFLATLLRRFDFSADRRTIVYAPDEKAEAFQAIGQDCWAIHPQSDGGLGQRLTEFCRQAVMSPEADSQKNNVVVIGSDCLDISTDLIENAFNCLNEYDVVVGPSGDGGYYLIGMSTFHPELFQNINWSTESVFEETISSLNQNQISHHVLDTHDDIDQREDLESLMHRLAEVQKSGIDLPQFELDLFQAVQTALATQ